MSEEAPSPPRHPTSQHLTVNAGDNNQIQVGDEVSGSQSVIALQHHLLVKRAEVAGEAMVTVLEYLDTLGSPLTPVNFGASNKTPREQFADQWAPVFALHQPFLHAQRRVQTYLGEAEIELMADIWAFKGQLFGLQSACLGERSMWEKAYGEHQVVAVRVLRKRAKELLKPIANLADVLK